MSDTRWSWAFMRLSCPMTTTLPAQWFRGKKREVRASPMKHDTPVIKSDLSSIFPGISPISPPFYTHSFHYYLLW